MDVDVRDIDCDFYVFTGHKLYGPTGIGVSRQIRSPCVRCRRSMARRDDHEVSQDRVTYDDRLIGQAGTPAIIQAIGLGAAIDYVNSIGRRRASARMARWSNMPFDRRRDQLVAHHRQCKRQRPRSIIRRLQGAHPHDVATVIDRQGVAVRAGTRT